MLRRAPKRLSTLQCIDRVNASIVANTPRFDDPWLRRLLGNWQLSPIITKHTGFWFSPASGTDASLTGVGLDRPNLLGVANLSSPALKEWFNTAVFKVNAPGTYGNAGRDSLVGPGSFDIDVALVRRFTIREGHDIEARGEAFNVLNHPAFANPDSTLTDADFGRILSAGDPRILQFAQKYTF